MKTGIEKVDGKWSVYFESYNQKFNLGGMSSRQNAEWQKEILDGIFARERLLAERNALTESLHGDVTLL